MVVFFLFCGIYGAWICFFIVLEVLVEVKYWVSRGFVFERVCWFSGGFR